MSTTRNDGGPAFPQGHLDGPHVDPSGMTLRDWFAGLAMQGWISSFGPDAPHPVANNAQDGIARLSYKVADALLKARDE